MLHTCRNLLQLQQRHNYVQILLWHQNHCDPSLLKGHKSQNLKQSTNRDTMLKCFKDNNRKINNTEIQTSNNSQASSKIASIIAQKNY